ncbi:DUF3320 domain-containing protein [Bradyrhizobium sp. LA6.7]|uniref:DUF3320 domain-containing protein n=1 Tax=unclassified Bradyrhizobium TaxID=2631580 RepID=UPI00339ADED5
MTSIGDKMILLEPNRVGQFVRARRKRLGYTQDSLAALANVGRQWLVELEVGKNRRPPLDLVIRVLSVLGCVLQVTDLEARGASSLQPPPPEVKISHGGNEDLRRAEPTKSQSADTARLGQPKGQEAEGAMFLGGDYETADFGSAGISVNQKHLYWPDYRGTLRSMVALIVDTEAPVFFDVLERRIASAHGQRLTNKMKVVIASLTKNFPSTPEGDRKVIWSSDPNIKALPQFRSDPQSLRDHSDIPLVELASLAASFLPGRTPNQVITLMSQHLGLSSVRAATRTRLLQAVADALQYAEAIEG